MDNKGFNKVFGVVTVLVLIGAAFYGYMTLNKPEVPVPAEDGSFKGLYTMEGIMALKKPYECRFEKSEGESKVGGVMTTDGSSMRGEFRIITPNFGLIEFDSSLVVKEGVAYTWTSIAPIGYKSSPAKSASMNASPEEQAQIIGSRDKVQYSCELLTNIDPTTFNPPSWVTFSELK